MSFPVWLLGVLLAIGASVVSNLGLNLQKRAHMNMSRAAEAAGSQTGPGPPSGTLGQGRRPRTSSMSVSLVDSDSTSRHTTPDKDVPTGGLSKKKRRSGNKSDYQLLIGEGEEEGSTHERRSTTLPTIPASPARSSDISALTPPALGSTLEGSSPHFFVQPESWTNPDELAQGSMVLDTYGAPPRAARANTNGQSRARSMSASTRREGQREGTRHTSRRTSRSSVLVDSADSSESSRGEKKAAKPSGHYTKQPIWILGLVCVIVGSLLDFAALAFVDQAVVAPLGSLTLVSNVFFAPLLLKEKVTRKQLYCTFLIVAGSCLAVAFAPHESASSDVEEMFDEFIKPRFIVYSLVVAAAVAGLRFACWRFRSISRSDPNGAYLRIRPYYTFAYAACAGIMGAQSVLFAKCAAMLLASSFAGHRVMFAYPATYGVLAGLGLTIFLQIRWLNSGLRMFSALMIVPIFQSFWILVSVIAGMVFFGEYEGVFSQTSSAALFPLGLLLTIVGVYFLTQIAPEEPIVPAAPPSTRRRGSRRSSSVSGAAGWSPSNAGSANGAPSAEEGLPSTPLAKAIVGDNYATATPPGPPGRRTRRPAPLGGSNAAAASLDHVVDLGSYSEEGTLPTEEEGDFTDSGDESMSEDESPQPAFNTAAFAAQHSLAPINFPMFLLPKSLTHEPATPVAPARYFSNESTSSDIGLTDLPYDRIFRIAPVREDDEEPASPSVRSMASPDSVPATPQRSVNGGPDISAVASPSTATLQQDEEWDLPAPASAAGSTSAFVPAAVYAYASPPPSHSPPRGDGLLASDLASSDSLVSASGGVSEYSSASSAVVDSASPEEAKKSKKKRSQHKKDTLEESLL